MLRTRSDARMLEWARWALFLLALLPLIYTNSFIFPYITARTLFFTILVQFAFLSACFVYLTQKKSVPYGPPLLLFSLFILWGLVTTALSTSPLVSFWSIVDRAEGYYLWFHVFLLFILLVQLFDRDSWYRWITYSYGVSIIVTIMGLAQYAGNYELTNNEFRVDVLFGNPIFLGLYVLFHIGFGTLLLLRSKNSLRSWFIAISLLFHVIVLFNTGTRGSLLALLGGIMMASFCYAILERDRTYWRIASISVIVGGILAISSILFLNDSKIFISHPILERFSTISITDLKNQSRYYLWEAAIDGISDSPIQGHGFEQFEQVFESNVEPAFYGTGLSSKAEHWVDRAHNMLLDIAVSTGIPGLLLFLALILYSYYIFFTTTRIRVSERAVCIGILTAYGVHSMFSFNVTTGLVLLVVIISYAEILYAKKRTLTLMTPAYLNKNLITLIILIIGIALLYISINRMTFVYQVRKIHDTTSEHSEERFIAYAELSHKNFIDMRYIHSQLPALATAFLNKHGTDSINNGEIRSVISSAEGELRAEDALTSRDLYYFGTAYSLMGQPTEAERVFIEGLVYAPQRLILLNALTKAYIRDKEYDSALSYATQAYTLESKHQNTVLLYAISLLYNDRIKESDAVLRSYYDSIYIADNLLLRAQIDAGLYDRAESTLLQSVGYKPERETHWKLLFDVYQRDGDTEELDRVYNKALEYHPSITLYD